MLMKAKNASASSGIKTPAESPFFKNMEEELVEPDSAATEANENSN